MNKAFEKIIEKLEDLEIHFDNDYFSSNREGMIVKNDAIEIVKQEAEKFCTDTNVVSNSWIPCNKVLPENGGYYLVTYHEWSKGNFLPKYNDTYVRKMHYQKSERFTGWNYPVCVDDRAENDTNREVIAWQPLPEVYKN